MALQLVNPLSALDADAIDQQIAGASTNAELYKAVAPVFEAAQQLVTTARNASAVVPAAQLAALEAAFARLQASRNAAKVAYASDPNSWPRGAAAAAAAVAGMFQAAGIAASTRLGTPLQQAIYDTLNAAGDTIEKAIPQIAGFGKWVAIGGAVLLGVYVLSQAATIARAVRA